MVNTFITTFENDDKDYRKTASNLDFARCKRQCFEAKSIVDVLDECAILSNYYGWDECPKQSANWADVEDSSLVAQTYIDQVKWIDSIIEKYSRLDKKVCIIEEKLVEIPKDQYIKIIPLKDRFQCPEKGKIDYKGRLYDRKEIIISEEGDKLITLGGPNITHPVIRMWVGCSEALKLYVNSHIEELKNKNTREDFEISINPFKIDKKKVIHPWWRNIKQIILCHQASLLRKEKGDKKWYRDRFTSSELDSYFKYGSIWPSKLDKDTICCLLEGKDVPIEKLAVNYEQKEDNIGERRNSRRDYAPKGSDNRPQRRSYSESRKDSTFGSESRGRREQRSTEPIRKYRDDRPRRSNSEHRRGKSAKYLDPKTKPRRDLEPKTKPRRDLEPKVMNLEKKRYAVDKDGFIKLNFVDTQIDLKPNKKTKSSDKEKSPKKSTCASSETSKSKKN
jgi:hypothetical protein